jgi:hypothetical protein
MLDLSLHVTDKDAWHFLHLLTFPKKCKKKGRIVFYKATFDKLYTVLGDITMIILTDTQEVDLAIAPKDRKRKPAQVEGIPVWSTSDPLICSITPAADGLSCNVKATDNLGDVQISVVADADLGEGVENITGIEQISVVAGKAVTMGISAGIPREQVI